MTMLAWLLAALAADPTPADLAFFEQKVRPTLAAKCYSCHSAEAKKIKGGLRLDTAEGIRRGGDSGAAVVVPGQPNASLLIQAVRHDGLKMPPDGKLSASEIAGLAEWVARGAPDPRTGAPAEAKRADLSWWSLQPLTTPAPPFPPGLPAAWAPNPVDRFVFAALAERKLASNPPAGRRELLRRVTYDLTGLPPTPEEVAAFVADERPLAYELAVNRLLASPHYGERWGRHWLDVVRFGESNGYERNVPWDNAWPFRDYVIRSFNDDKPYPQLFIEHLAGDAIANGRREIEIGAAFLTLGTYDDVGNQDPVAAANIRAIHLDEMVTATASAFLGLTVNCARCHHHKFDPIPTEDYYRLKAAFEGVRHGAREWATPAERQRRAETLAPLEAERRNELAKQRDAAKSPADRTKAAAALKEAERKIAAVPPLPTAWLGTREQPKERPVVFIGGDPARPAAAVQPASLSTLSKALPGFALPADAPEAERRLALAKWLADARNPLPPRVLANRVWQHHFGTGIVDSPGDFGFLGGAPTHPALLDWLARRLLAHGGRLKPLHRDIVLSQTYRQSAAFRADGGAADRESRFLWRFPPRRLAAEEIRDTLLAVSGALDLKMGGPGFRLYEHRSDNVSTYLPLATHGRETYRRSVYHQNVRASVVDVLSDFDLPDNAFPAPRRTKTTSPLQALALLNHRFVFDMAAALAERTGKSAGVPERIGRAYELAYQRRPTPAEAEAAAKLVAAHGLPALCRALLNANELLYLE